MERDIMKFFKLTVSIACSVFITGVNATEEIYTYTSNSLISSIDGKRIDVSDVTTFIYDGQNNLNKITNSLGQETTFSNYTAKGKPTTIIDSNNVSTQLLYDVRGRLTSWTRGNRTTTHQYNDFGLLISTLLPWGDEINYVYDDARRLIQMTNSANESIVYSYNTKDNITKTQYINSNSVTVGEFDSTFDELGRKLSETAGYLNRTYNYDTKSNITNSSVGNNSTTNDYDELNRLTKITDALAGETILAYDTSDVLTSVTDAGQNITQYSPDFKGDNETLTSQATGVTQFTTDEAGNTTSRTDARGISTQYAYDSLNRLVSISYSGSEENVTYNYDSSEPSRYGIGQLTSIVQINNSLDYYYNEFGEISKASVVINGNNYHTIYNYDKDLLIKIVYPSGREILYTYNTLGKVTKVESYYQGKSLTLAENISYLPYGLVNSLSYGNGKVLTNTFDDGYFLTNKQISGVHDYTYSYDTGGNIEIITDNLASSNDLTLTYDLKHRLIDASSSPSTSQFSYDETDNRISKLEDGNFDNYGYEQTKLTTLNSEMLSYDNNGNLIQRGDDVFTYNQANRLSSATLTSGSFQYTYNALGQRINKQGLGINTHYVYNNSGQLIYETDTISNITTEYVYLNGKRLTLHQGAFSTDEIIDDDNDESTTINGEWSLVTKGKNVFYGNGYLKSSKGSGENAVVWPIFNSTLGQYQVYARWVENRKNANDAPYTINHVSGQDIVSVDQTTSGNSWQLLGIYTLDTQSSITLNNNANGNVVADAIKIVPLDGSTVYKIHDYFIHTNHVDAPIILTDMNANTVWQANYLPFGEATVDDDFDGDGAVVVYNARLPGQYYDQESGLYYNYFRYYDSETGRYIQSDPIGLIGDINTYGYVGGNPINKIDPSGLLEVRAYLSKGDGHGPQWKFGFSFTPLTSPSSYAARFVKEIAAINKIINFLKPTPEGPNRSSFSELLDCGLLDSDLKDEFEKMFGDDQNNHLSRKDALKYLNLIQAKYQNYSKYYSSPNSFLDKSISKGNDNWWNELNKDK